MGDNTLMWISAILIYPLLTSDPHGSSWAFLLGAELAIGLYYFLRIALSV